jgi:hypothetical protein
MFDNTDMINILEIRKNIKSSNNDFDNTLEVKNSMYIKEELNCTNI